MMGDWELLRQYVDQGSRAALDALVARHVAMVYAAALREVGDPHQAQDITQAVFLVLMRRAPSLSRKVLLAGWLFQVVHFTAADARKAATRRRYHERQAAEMRSNMSNPPDEPETHRLIPLLNDAIASLGARERDAVVMCYLQGCSHRQVALAQRASENAVRQRLFRAVHKLRARLRGHGIDASPTVIAAALTKAAAGSAPPGLATAIGQALSAAHAAGHSTALAHAMIRSMHMLKIKMISAACAACVFVSAGACLVAHAIAADSPPAATAPPVAAPAATEPGAPATQPTTAPGPAAQPMDTVKNTFEDIQSGEADACVSCFDHPTDDQVKTLKSVVHALSAVTELRKAVADKFGEEAGNQMIIVCGAGILLKKNIDNMPVTVTGDKADVGQGDSAMHLVKAGDVWKITPDADKLAKAAPFFENIEDQIPQIKTMIADVKSGKYASGDDVKSALQDLVSPKQGNGM
jgi:RNA polymerase sigma factor (sigma-70 family)